MMASFPSKYIIVYKRSLHAHRMHNHRVTVVLSICWDRTKKMAGNPRTRSSIETHCEFMHNYMHAHMYNVSLSTLLIMNCYTYQSFFFHLQSTQFAP